MYQKGQSGNPAGRPKGTPDKIKQEVRELARQLFDAAYWTRTKAKLLDGSLNPSIEAKLLSYAYGEPQHDHDAAAGIHIHLGFIEPRTLIAEFGAYQPPDRDTVMASLVRVDPPQIVR